MGSSAEAKINLHLDILPKETKTALDFLSKQKWMEPGWYLAGGTALALQARHRKSIDLDFFIKRRNFDSPELLSLLSMSDSWETDFSKENSVYGRLFESEVKNFFKNEVPSIAKRIIIKA